MQREREILNSFTIQYCVSGIRAKNPRSQNPLDVAHSTAGGFVLPISKSG